jgi:hypothetical protein
MSREAQNHRTGIADASMPPKPFCERDAERIIIAPMASLAPAESGASRNARVGVGPLASLLSGARIDASQPVKATTLATTNVIFVNMLYPPKGPFPHRSWMSTGKAKTARFSRPARPIN